MIFYATKETLEKYKLKTPEQLSESIQPFARAMIENEQGDQIMEWGCKLFYFDRRKCLQLLNFKTRFVVFLVDIKMSDVNDVPNMLAHYLFSLYETDGQMQTALEKYFASSPFACYDKITNRSMITKLNQIQRDWAFDGYRFYEYIRDGILHTMEINRDVNDMPCTIKENGKEEWHIPYKYFRDEIKNRFGH